MVEIIATLITVLCGILAIIIVACTIQAPYSKYVLEQHNMTIRRSYSNSILTSISEFLIILIIILIVAVSISKYCADYDYYNYVELKAQYKNYIVTNKYIRNSDTYVLELMNPFSKKTKEVYVRDYLYYNTYFVGDTIK